jgi:four helix bundle protein
MPTFERFEDIQAWQKARALTRELHAVSDRGRFARDFALRDQVRRACVSVTSNIAEGFERGGTGDLVQFLAVAKGSLGEVRSQLYVALDQGYIEQADFARLAERADEISRRIGALIGYLRHSGIRGSRLKAPRPPNSDGATRDSKAET